MKLKNATTALWIADFINAELIGEAHTLVTGINEIHKVVAGDVTFVDFEKYYDKCLQSPATVIIINKKVPCPKGKVLLICDYPFDAYVKLAQYFQPFRPSDIPMATSAVIGENTIVMPNCFIGNQVIIGSNCIIHPNVTIYDHTIIGDNTIIHAGSIIGADAFYFKRKRNETIQYHKLWSCGQVIIKDYVEIGAGTTIDRGVSGDTIIGNGTKIDNQVHIGHGAVIGDNCLIAAQVGIAGKTIIEDEVIIWGQVGINKDLTIGRGAEILAQSGVPSSIKGGKTYFGTPVKEARQKMKELAYAQQLPQIWQLLVEDKKE